MSSIKHAKYVLTISLSVIAAAGLTLLLSHSSPSWAQGTAPRYNPVPIDSSGLAIRPTYPNRVGSIQRPQVWRKDQSVMVIDNVKLKDIVIPSSQNTGLTERFHTALRKQITATGQFTLEELALIYLIDFSDRLERIEESIERIESHRR